MSSTLNPSLSVAQNMKNSILGVLQSDFPGETRALMIAPLLSSFNKWTTQIPLMLEGTGHSASANLVFAVRKELFHSPAFSTCTLGIPLKELPQAFTEFLEFIQKLQDAQRFEKDKVILKVHSLFFLLVVIILTTLFLSLLVAVVKPLSPKRLSMTRMTKTSLRLLS